MGQNDKIKVLVVGCGHMGSSHAKAYQTIDGFEIVGLVAPTPVRRTPLAKELGEVPEFDNFDVALDETSPQAVSINSYTDTHAEYAIKSLNVGLHVFVEKPIAETVEQAQKIASLAKEKNKKVVVGYILRHHPAWMKFIEIAQSLGKPLVMRMNLNQQSCAEHWQVHKNLMLTTSPIVDCGVHYVDVMCQMTRSKPKHVQAIGARLSEELTESMYNYGQLQVVFEDGSVGWYEAGWGPMMSETAFFVKDCVGPKGCVSIVEAKSDSANIDRHTKTNALLKHDAQLAPDGQFLNKDITINTSDEPDHQQLCDREQLFFLKAIQQDLDLTEHLNDAVNSLRIVLAADDSVRTGQVVNL
ncbi:MAG: Gfo/Idh/MocA family protein [Planctomycetota bacterium]|jgi:predicted dehydrogenase